jgi:hypothetical protein
MELKSFGCSFIFGSDLSDYLNVNKTHKTHKAHATIPSQLTWPAILSSQLGYDYQCHARPGAGNLIISDIILNHLVSDKSALYVIGWSWIDRFDYTNSFISRFKADIIWKNWKTLRPESDSDLAKTYYQGLHSEYRDKLTSLLSIKTVIDVLKQKELPFIMTYMDELLFDRTHNTTPAIVTLQDYVRPYMTMFEGKTFLDWSRKYGYPESAGWHPLEQAHAEGAKVMRQAFDRQNTNVR